MNCHAGQNCSRTVGRRTPDPRRATATRAGIYAMIRCRAVATAHAVAMAATVPAEK